MWVLWKMNELDGCMGPRAGFRGIQKGREPDEIPWRVDPVCGP